MEADDLAGKRFGKLTVVKRGKRSNNREQKWVCKCDCGNVTEVRASSLKEGHTASCGCHIGNHVHDMSGTSTYRTWVGIRTRCYRKSSSAYKYYGGRGIKMCDRWYKSFKCFFDDMGEKPKGLSIDRIDSNGDYEPGNCRWADIYTQNGNKRDTHKITINGETKPLSVWARHYGKNIWTVSRRINKYHWEPIKALTTPIDKRRDLSRIIIGDETMSLIDWCKKNGIHEYTARNRISRGWDVIEAVTSKAKTKHKTEAVR